MFWISALLFVSSFAVIVLLIMAKGGLAPVQMPGVVRAMSDPLSRSRAVTDVRKVVLFSAIPWLNKLLMKLEFASQLRRMIYQAGLKWTVGRMTLMSLAAGILPGYGALLFTRSLALAIAAGIPLSMVPLGIVVILRRRRFNEFEEGLPKVLDMMVSALRAGHSFNAALGLAAREGPEPISSEFRICFDEQNFGLDLRHAMENLMTRVPLTDLRIAATAVLIQKETGGNLAEVLDNTSEVIRERARLKRQMRVHTAHGRMTGWVIGCLPFALFIVLYILNPQMESMLWKHEMGIKLLYGGGAMMVIGVLVIRKIVRADV
jgi:tight adherence protein B